MTARPTFDHRRTPAAGTLVERTVMRAAPKRDNSSMRESATRRGFRLGAPDSLRAHGLNSRGRLRAILSKPMTGRKDGHQIAARESAGAGGFDSRSLAEIVVKERVRIAHGGASLFASALGVEGGLTAGKDRHPTQLARFQAEECLSAHNARYADSAKSLPNP